MEFKNLKIKIFADGADIDVITNLVKNPWVKGLTTNPTLMRKSRVTDYKAFAQEVIRRVPELPISFEVFSDDFSEMALQALEIASWGKNVYVKIPVTNTQGVFTGSLIKDLASQNVQLNVTALMTPAQVEKTVKCLSPDTRSFISVFAGRIADTGRDPMPLMKESLQIMRYNSKSELIWASPRELLNIFQADSIGCHIITATNDVLAKLPLVGKNLDEFSLETVQMFHRDAEAAKFRIEVSSGKI